MAAEDVALALTMLANEEILTEATRGDLRRFEGFDFSEEEQDLVVAATRGVVTIEEQVPVPFREEAVETDGPGGPERGYAYWPPATAEAIRYVQGNIKDPRIQATFVAWQEARRNEFP